MNLLDRKKQNICSVGRLMMERSKIKEEKNVDIKKPTLFLKGD